MEQVYFTYKELAEYLRVSIGTIYRWKELYNLPYLQRDKTVRFRKDQIDRWFEKGQIIWEVNRTCQECKKKRDLTFNPDSLKRLEEDSKNP